MSEDVDSPEELDAGAVEQWASDYAATPLRDADFETMSGIPLEPVYGPGPRGGESGAGDDGAEWPGVYPYTRGPYASMYRSKLWTMRMFAGFGTAEDTNARFRDLLRAGGDGLSVAFDLPTLMGRDSDDP
ncbi:MAG TPA: methylmalonyl-CoA mutase family protein, partial [Acidimicrobiales bacterium]|nr:methylmalonyl-CoA mutase family protein [Acidimicrobiales bacterium]